MQLRGVRAGTQNTSAQDDAQLLWQAFDRSLGRPLDRPERLRIDGGLGLSSLEVTTLRKILGWLRQIDATADATGLAPAAHGSTSLLIPVEHGRVVLTSPLLSHLRSTSRPGESDALALVRWLCSMARHHRALPWELVHHEVQPFAPSARRLTPLEILLACRPNHSAPDDLACSFAAQADSLVEQTWIFARSPDSNEISGLIFARAPEQRSLSDVYDAAAYCAQLLTYSAQLRLLGPRRTTWFAIDDELLVSVAGPLAISLQRAPMRSMGLILARLNALEQT